MRLLDHHLVGVVRIGVQAGTVPVRQMGAEHAWPAADIDSISPYGTCETALLKSIRWPD